MRVLVLLAFTATASAQQPSAQYASAERGPRFLFATARETVTLDVSRTPALRRRVSIDASRQPLKGVLDEIARQAGLSLSFSPDVVNLGTVVTLEAKNLTVAAALTEVLMDLRVDVVLSSTGQLSIVRQPAPPVVGMISGIVTEAATGQPIPQAQVSVVGTALRHATGQDGSYAIAGVPAGPHKVTVRRLGYDPISQDITVRDGESATLDFALIRVPTRLAEVVTTVTGGQRRMEVGNTIATINADSLMRIAPVMSFGDLLQGRAPGVLSLPEGGSVGQAGRIRIRGLNSFQVANDPIVVVDGARVEASAGQTVTGSGGLTGRLADFDPDEIASVEVIKGPAAATLYGTDAANGVIVITTKRGQAGRTRWTAFTEQGRLTQGLDLTDAFTDAYYAFGRSTTTNAPQRCTLLQRAAGSCVVDSLGSFNAFTDPATRPFKDGRRQQYGLQVSGGTVDGTTYFLSGAVEQETGTAYMPTIDQALIRTTQGREVPDWQVRPNAYERMNLRANMTTPLGRRGSATLAAGFVSNQTRMMQGDFPFSQVGYRDVNDGWFGGGTSSDRRPAYAFALRQDDAVRRLTGSLVTNYSVRNWLTLRGTAGTDLSTNASGRLLRRGERLFNTGERRTNDVSITLSSLDLGATATRALSVAVSSKTSVGVQYNRRAERGSRSGIATNLPVGGETGAGGTLATQPIEATLTTAVAGGYVEEVLGLRDRLFLSGALRFDGGSAFGQDFSVAAYPKASLSWVASDGQSGPRLPGVTALRLRAAYGVSGVQPGPTDALSRITVATGFDVAGTASAPGGTLVAGNPDLKPERTNELEAGLDLELWASRVRLEFTTYRRTTADALVNRPNGPDVGGSRFENLGSVRNRGHELLVSADLVRGRGLVAGFTATGALNENELRQLGEGVLVSSPLAEGSRQDVGYPVFGQWGFLLESFTDANGNGIIEPTELVLAGPNSQYVGPGFATREATVAPYVKLLGERLHLSGLLQYRGGFYRNRSALINSCFNPTASCRAVNDLSTPLDEQARVVARTSFLRFGPVTEDASYLLLRELSLGHTLPPSVARVFGARGGQVVLAGRNLGLLWKASDIPLENALFSFDSQTSAAQGPGSSTYWLLRVHFNY